MTFICSLGIHVLKERGCAYSIAIVKTGKAIDDENLIIIFILLAFLMISKLLVSILRAIICIYEVFRKLYSVYLIHISRLKPIYSRK